MELPIDARLAPFREKYLDEQTPLLAHWFIFGKDVADDTIQIVTAAAGNDDVFVGLSAAQAQEIEIVRRDFVRKIVDILNRDR